MATSSREISLISKTVALLDSYQGFYKRISRNRYNNYEEYITKGKFTDEERLVRPEFLRDFTQKILGFNTGTLSYQDPDNPLGDRPDATPFDTRVHPFVIETKGSDSDDLTRHFKQLKKYIDSNEVKWGVIFNLRECIVFASPTDLPNIDLHFSFIELHRRYKAYKRREIKALLGYENTKAFLSFVKRFSRKKITQTDKIQKIAKAKKWTGLETLDPGVLTDEVREIVKILHDDVKNKKPEIKEILKLNPERKKKIALEIDNIAGDIDPKKTKREITNETLNLLLKARRGALDHQALDSYLYRVAYFTMTKILLVRAWEDIGFIDQTLYDGGFEDCYERMKHKLEEVLDYAFHLAGKRYSWLFNIENNYTWYTPSEDALIEVLYRFSNFNLSLLSTDVLGYVYEEYLDITDRKNKGQYYTPREIIRFIWDRVGFTKNEAFFRIEGRKRNARLIYDSATGSGGFLVEATRRIRQEARYNKKDFDDLLEIFLAIVSGIYGSEIQAFPYYITEVNLLLQLTPVVKDMLETNPAYFQRDWALNVIQQDSLKLHNPLQPTLTGLEEEFKSKDEIYEKERHYDIVHLEGLKRTAYEFIKNHKDFDFICANPPYIGEKGHKELFRSTIKNFPYWKQFYQGKMDYLYFFIELGLSKLRDGGKLGFITSAYWPTADGASKLRQYILENSRIKEVIFFGEIKLFEHAKGQHNMVFVLERRRNKETREGNKIKVVVVKKELEGRTVKDRLQKLVNHINKNISKRKYSDKYINVFISPMQQRELSEDSWDLQLKPEAAKITRKMDKIQTKLNDFCSISQGVVPSPLRLTKEKLKELPQEYVKKYNLKIGDGVFVLNKNELESLYLAEKEKQTIRPYYKNSDIKKYIALTNRSRNLIYTDSKVNIDDIPRIKKHLEKFRPMLESRLTRYNESYRWFELHRSRNQKIFEGEKIVCGYRSQRGTFAYNIGSFYGSTDMYFLKKKNEKDLHSLKYLAGVLNSQLIDLYLSNKGKLKGPIKEQFVTPLENLPIPKINFADSRSKISHDNIVKTVGQIIKAKKELNKYDNFYPNIQLLDLQDIDNLPDSISLSNVVKKLPKSKFYSLRTDIRIEHSPRSITKFFLKKVDKKGILQPNLSGKLQFRLVGKNRKIVSITGPKEILDYLSKVLPAYQGKSWQEIKNKVLIPKKLSELEKERRKVEKTVTSLTNKINNLQGKIDQLVYKLYGLTKKEIKIVEEEVK